jgi:hypothetical protein
VVDSGGMTDAGSFLLTVVDTTAPVLASIADVALTTGDPTGTTLAFGSPAVADAVDPSPSVACAPAARSKIPVGTTKVTCTATDASGNHSSTSFDALVTYVPPVTWSAVWGEPVGTSGATFVANPGRNLPVKVEIFANGVERTHGTASLSVVTCAGTAAGTLAMSWGAGRWNGTIDTGALGGSGCYAVTAFLDGHAAGSFRIELRGPDAASNGAGPKGRGRG